MKTKPDSCTAIPFSVSITQADLNFLQLLLDTGIFPSKSEAIRYCIRRTVPELSKMYAEIKTYIDNGNVIDIKDLYDRLGYVLVPKKYKPFLKQAKDMYIVSKKKGLGNIWWEDHIDHNGNITKVPINRENVEEE